MAHSPRRRAEDALRKLKGSVRCSVELDPGSDADGDAPRWIMVAYEGSWRGHYQGAFTFDRATFETIVRNFRSHPAYHAGPDGVGDRDVVAFDFAHVSEADPTRGDIPVVGTPAQAWALDLDVRSGNGRSELWALTRFLEPAKTYIRERKLKWVSVSVWFDAVDAVSGAPIGPMLTSVALTNRPFLTGLPEISASYRFDPYAPPRTAHDVLCALREVFELPATVGLGEVIAEIAKLRTWAAPGAAPPLGVDVGELVGSLRAVFNLPTMAAVAEVLAEADKLLARLADEQAAAAPTTPAATPASPPAPAVTASARPLETSMTAPAATDLRALLAQRLNLKLEEASDARLLLAVDQGQQAVDTLTALFEALEVPNAGAAAAKAAELMKSAATLAKLMPEFETLKQESAKVEEQKAEADVEAAMQAHAMPPSAKKSMLMHRRNDAEDFRKTYPAPDPKQAHLSQPFFTPPPRPASAAAPSVLDRIQASRGGLHVTPPIQPPPALGSGAAAVNLSAYPGANDVERAIGYLRSQGDKRPFHEIHAAACDLARASRPAH